MAKRIRALRAKGIKWEKICLQLGILKDNGEPDTGLAYQIGINQKEPKGEEVRDRLGLRKVCLACMRGFRRVSASARSLSPWRLWWNRLKPAERDSRIKSEYEKEL